MGCQDLPHTSASLGLQVSAAGIVKVRQNLWSFATSSCPCTIVHMHRSLHQHDQPCAIPTCNPMHIMHHNALSKPVTLCIPRATRCRNTLHVFNPMASLPCTAQPLLNLLSNCDERVRVCPCTQSMATPYIGHSAFLPAAVVSSATCPQLVTASLSHNMRSLYMQPNICRQP